MLISGCKGLFYGQIFQIHKATLFAWNTTWSRSHVTSYHSIKPPQQITTTYIHQKITITHIYQQITVTQTHTMYCCGNTATQNLVMVKNTNKKTLYIPEMSLSMSNRNEWGGGGGGKFLKKLWCCVDGRLELWRSANARNHCLGFINSVDETALSCNFY